jgi:hypothetical protein
MQISEFTQSYAFTITLLPKFNKLTTRRQLHRTYEYVLEFLQPHKVSLVYELTKQMNIHYHGIINFKYSVIRDKVPILYWYNLLRRQSTVGYTVLKPMEDEEGWKEYITKDVMITLKTMSNQTHLSPILSNKHDLSYCSENDLNQDQTNNGEQA